MIPLRKLHPLDLRRRYRVQRIGDAIILWARRCGFALLAGAACAIAIFALTR